MSTFTDIIDRWPDQSALADDLELNYDQVRKWRYRNSIPPEFWSEMLVVAKRRRIPLKSGELIEAAARN